MSFETITEIDNAEHMWLPDQVAIINLQQDSVVSYIRNLHISDYSFTYSQDDTFEVIISIQPNKDLKGVDLFNYTELQEAFDSFMTEHTPIHISVIHTTNDQVYLIMKHEKTEIKIEITGHSNVGYIMEIFNRVLQLDFCKGFETIERDAGFPNLDAKLHKVCYNPLVPPIITLPPIIL